MQQLSFLLYRAILGKEAGTFSQIIAELWEYIKTKYFTIEYREYDNLGINLTGGRFSVETFIICVGIGMIIACFAASFNRGALGQFVKELLSEECLSPEKAKTLNELGFGRNSAVRSAVRKNRILRKYLRCIEEDNGTLMTKSNKEGTVALEEAHFYIPEEHKYVASVRFEEKKKVPVIMYIIMVIAIIALTIFLIGVLPDLLGFLDSFVGHIRPDSNILT